MSFAIALSDEQWDLAADIPGDLVDDLFAGSGSTLVAAERTGRRCAALELDPIRTKGTLLVEILGLPLAADVS